MYGSCVPFTATPLGSINPGVPANLTIALTTDYPGVQFFDIGSSGCSGTPTNTLHLPAGCASTGFTFYVKPVTVGPWNLSGVASDSNPVSGYSFFTQGILVPVGFTDQLVPNSCSPEFHFRIVDQTSPPIHALSPNHSFNIGFAHSSNSKLKEYDDAGCTTQVGGVTPHVRFFADAGVSEPASIWDGITETTTVTPLIPAEFQMSIQSSPFQVTSSTNSTNTCAVTGQYCDGYASNCCGGCQMTSVGEVWPCN